MTALILKINTNTIYDGDDDGDGDDDNDDDNIKIYHFLRSLLIYYLLKNLKMF